MLVKEYAKQLFGIDNFIRLDMSEYKESHSISKIIGSPPGYVGYGDYKNVLEQVREKPHSVILLDEIEKAHPSVLHLFLQVLDEGILKDSKGNVVRFDHTIIFMTSNLGYQKNNVGFFDHKEQDVLATLKDVFSLEFINRLDHVFLFDKMKKENAILIIKMRLEQLKKRFSKKNIKLEISDGLIEQILKLSKYEEFGARKIDKIIYDKVDVLIIDGILAGKKKIKIEQIV